MKHPLTGVHFAAMQKVAGEKGATHVNAKWEVRHNRCFSVTRGTPGGEARGSKGSLAHPLPPGGFWL